MGRTLTIDEWETEARDRFGDDKLDWKFVCPVCKHVASVRDWMEAKAPEGAVAFSCVGRYLDMEQPHLVDGEVGAPCDYAGGGLFRLNPVHITKDDGTTHDVFEFADDWLERVESD